MIYQLKNDDNIPDSDSDFRFMFYRDFRNYDFRTSVFKEEELPTLTLWGKNADLFNEICFRLRKEQNLEYLEYEKISNELWNLLFDFFLSDAKLNEVDNFIEKFQKKIEIPYINWFVYFPLKNFKYEFDFEFYPYKIVRDYVKDREIHAIGEISELSNRPAVKITVLANNDHSAKIKAKKRFMEFSTIMSLIHSKSIRTGWCKIPFPEIYFMSNENSDYMVQNHTFSRQIFGCTKIKEVEFHKNASLFSEMILKGVDERNDIERRIFRAMEWFFKATSTRDIPDKLNYYFFLYSLQGS
ncbi:MAG: hypothetical protein ACFE9L_12190 [Candidatus Hodarchaeota archaeon]